MSEKKISLIIPVFNEEKNLAQLYDAIKPVVAFLPYMWEVLFVNDGSRDGSSRSLEMLAARDERVKVIEFTRNFGKEVAMSAGIEACTGEACIILDADLQHPVEKIPEFIKEWEKGSDVVVGVRTQNAGAGLMKRIGSRVFYFLMKRISDTRMVPHATDYRLLDRKVMMRLSAQRKTDTRGLIDWLGFTTSYIYFSRMNVPGRAWVWVREARAVGTDVRRHPQSFPSARGRVSGRDHHPHLGAAWPFYLGRKIYSPRSARAQFYRHGHAGGFQYVSGRDCAHLSRSYVVLYRLDSSGSAGAAAVCGASQDSFLNGNKSLKRLLSS